MKSRVGRLIALEGVDGCGKTTQAARLASDLGALLTHEPGATELGAQLRRLLLDPQGPPPVTRAELLLLAADRAQHVELVLAPALAAGRWVVTDRYSGSTLAYQGFGRGLRTEDLEPVLHFATAGLGADLSVLVDVDGATARRRLGNSAPDRLERLDPDFFERVRQGYRAQAAADPEHWVTVDGAGSIDQVAVSIGSAVTARLGQPGS